MDQVEVHALNFMKAQYNFYARMKDKRPKYHLCQACLDLFDPTDTNQSQFTPSNVTNFILTDNL